MSSQSRRWPYYLVALVFLLVIAGFAAFQYASHILKNEIVSALGGKGEVEAIAVTWGSVEITGIRIPGGKGWPAEDQLRAKRITLIPSIADLMRGKIRIRKISIEEAYLAILRDQKGKIHIIPDLTEAPDSGAGSEIEVVIDAIELANASLDFFDASVRRPPLKIQMDSINARISNLHFPALTGMSDLLVDAVIRGKQHHGKAHVEGKIELASMESDLKLRLSNVDLTALQAYLIQAANTGIKRGSMSMSMHSVVRSGRLNAPGTLTLSQLELSDKNPLFGVAQKTALAALKDSKGEISVQFVLDGDINSPNFSLNERIMSRMGNALTEKLGGSVKGVGQAVGDLGERGKNLLKGIGGMEKKK